LEKFNLLDLIARLGEAVLSKSDKKQSDKVKSAQEKTGDLKTEDTSFADEKSKTQKNFHAPSTSEKAFVEMLRRHDKKSKEIDEKVKALQNENGE